MKLIAFADLVQVCAFSRVPESARWLSDGCTGLLLTVCLCVSVSSYLGRKQAPQEVSSGQTQRDHAASKTRQESLNGAAVQRVKTCAGQVVHKTHEHTHTHCSNNAHDARFGRAPIVIAIRTRTVQPNRHDKVSPRNRSRRKRRNQTGPRLKLVVWSLTKGKGG